MKKQTNTNPPKETPIDDLYLAAYLRHRQFPLIRIDESHRGLIFVLGDVTDSAIAEYFSDGSKAYADHIKEIKGLILRWKRRNGVV